MKFYNSLTNRKEEFVPMDTENVKMYSCGPTVYGRAHVGNFSAYLFSDLMYRWLANRHLFADVEKWNVTKISNITDVGHLVGDGDEGEDKLEKSAREAQKSVMDIARHWEEIYHQDEEKLNIAPAKKYPRASEYVEEIIDFVKKLEEKGFAYENSDGVYFDISKFPEYGKLSGNTLENLSVGAGGRIDEEQQLEKRNPQDFAMWKKIEGKNEKHTLWWDSPWGKGFPGWHIECTAMILAELGEQIDIHTGGEDNIFPHHECEIAQMEALTDKKFCNFWMHKGFIQINAKKMSKSEGTVLNLDDVIEAGYSPLDLRYLFLSVHYRQQLNFTWEGLEGAKKARKKINNFYNNLGDDGASSDARQKFFDYMEDDLNVSGALSVIFDGMKNGELDKNFIEDFDKVFGVLDQEKIAEEIPGEVLKLLEKRKTARAEKNWALSDEIRNEISEMGYVVEDGGGGQEVQKK